MIMTLGERIKKLRTDKGLTQLELANSLFVTDRAISKWEQGRGNPDLNTLPDLARIFNVSIDYLLTGEEHAPSLDDKQNELISYFESMIGQELTNEYLRRTITKHLEKYKVSEIKDALDTCYDTYLLRKEKPLEMEDVKDALNKVGGILYNNNLPMLDRMINRLLNCLSKNTIVSSSLLRKECEDSIRDLLDKYSTNANDESKLLEVVDRMYKISLEEKLDLNDVIKLNKKTIRNINEKQKWKEIDISSEHIETDPFASIGNGRLKLSIGACKLINNFDSYYYVTFTKAKQDRIYFVGLRFERRKSKNSFRLIKDNDGEFGVTILASDLLKALYGEESTAETYTKHEVIVDPNSANTLVVYYNYKKKYSIRSDDQVKRIRSKHIGTIIDKEWKVISCSGKAQNGKRYPTYIVKNINTEEEVEISTRALIDIERGLTSIESIKTSREIGVASYLGKRRAAKKKRIAKIKE